MSEIPSASVDWREIRANSNDWVVEELTSIFVAHRTDGSGSAIVNYEDDEKIAPPPTRGDAR